MRIIMKMHKSFEMHAKDSLWALMIAKENENRYWMIVVIFNYFKTSLPLFPPVDSSSPRLQRPDVVIECDATRVLRCNCNLYGDSSRAAVSSRKVSRCSARRNSIVTKIITAVYHEEETQEREREGYREKRVYAGGKLWRYRSSRR